MTKGRAKTPMNSLVTPAACHPDFTYHLLRYLRAHPEHREDIRVVRVTRNEAAARLGISKSTLDRMIKRGELTTETEQHFQLHTVWVLMDDETEDIAEVSTGNTNGHFPEVSEHIEDDIGTKNLALQVEVNGLREMGGPVPRKTDRLRLALPGAYGAIQDHDEGPAHGARGTSPSETPVVALPVNPGHYNQGTEQAHSRPEDRIEIPGELDVKGRTDTDRREFQGICPHRMRFNPNPPMDGVRTVEGG